MVFINKNSFNYKFLTIIPIGIFCMFCFCATAQSTFIPLNDKQYDILERLEIKSGTQGNLFSAVKPFERKDAVAFVEAVDSMHHRDVSYADLSEVDKYDMQEVLMDNSEWSKPSESFLSKKPVFGANGIYKTKDNLFEVNTPDLFLAINPVVYFAAGKEKGNDNNLYQNTRGLTLRGIIDKKIGFNLYFTDNQERDPSYIMDYVYATRALPGEGNIKTSAYNHSGELDYFDARGSATWAFGKHVDMQFGFDQNVIGDGYRSLLLSDFSNSATFLKTNFKIWKLNYESVLMELYTPHANLGDVILGKKYGRFSDISINTNGWFNAGLFEGVIFATKNKFNGQYILPVMFYRPFGSAGSNANAVYGLHAKANLANHLQLYGQAAFDGFHLGGDSWNNTNGFQAGLKYIDVFGLYNTDIQVEYNQVRPYTYASNDSISNYTHYNLPLAHPLGANFREVLAILKMQPLPKLRLSATFIHYFQGLDSAGLNYGSNPFENYDTRPGDDGFNIGIGNRATCNLISGLASYELKENLFIDLSATYRKYTLASNTLAPNESTSIMLAIRWNIAHRDFNF
jgi:hypothetical protein